jgi:hypothetical protein
MVEFRAQLAEKTRRRKEADYQLWYRNTYGQEAPIDDPASLSEAIRHSSLSGSGSSEPPEGDFFPVWVRILGLLDILWLPELAALRIASLTWQDYKRYHTSPIVWEWIAWAAGIVLVYGLGIRVTRKRH